MSSDAPLQAAWPIDPLANEPGTKLYRRRGRNSQWLPRSPGTEGRGRFGVCAVFHRGSSAGCGTGCSGRGGVGRRRCCQDGFDLGKSRRGGSVGRTFTLDAQFLIGLVHGGNGVVILTRNLQRKGSDELKAEIATVERRQLLGFKL